ncbi:Complexin-1, partial [Ophiophagus hannah]
MERPSLLKSKLSPLINCPYGIKKKEEREAEAQAALEANAEGSLTRPKKAIPPGCGDEEEEEEESILDTVIKYLPGPLQDMFKNKAMDFSLTNGEFRLNHHLSHPFPSHALLQSQPFP